MDSDRFISLLLLLFGVEFIAAGRPFQGSGGWPEVLFLVAGVACLSIYHAILWDRGE